MKQNINTTMNMNTILRKAFVLVLLLAFSLLSIAKIKLPTLVGNGMVLQREIQIPIWGWADANEKISISFNNKTYDVVADREGNWTTTLQAMKAGGPHEMRIKGNTDDIVIKDILIGDVWFCSGQSNMQMRMKELAPAYTLTDEDNYPNIRQIEVGRNASFTIEDNVASIGWRPATPQQLPAFSGVAYFFAKDLYKKYNVPIGLINASWGGSKAEAWVSEEGLKEFPHYITRFNEIANPAFALGLKDAENGAAAEWNKKVATLDRGLRGRVKWYENALNDADWHTMELPNYWETHTEDLKGFDGAVWFRKKIVLDKNDLDNRTTIFLSHVDELDSTYVNGKFLQATYGRHLERSYSIPEEMLREGENVISIRVTDWGGDGGFKKGKNGFRIVVGSKEISLEGDWKYKQSLALSEMPSFPKTEQLRLHYEPALLYNGMVAAVQKYGIKGTIWYQGESNVDKAEEYKKLMPALVADWRAKWGQGNFPFLFVQLANYKKFSPDMVNSQWASLRDAQLDNLTTIPNSGMAVIMDVGEANDIHPKNKWDVGKRLALAAQKVAYGEKNVIYSGPIYKQMKVVGNTIEVEFDHTGTGLAIRKGEETLGGFFISEDGTHFLKANAKIVNGKVIVSNSEVLRPVAVRYAWQDNPETSNLVNKEGLPASPFKTDK